MAIEGVTPDAIARAARLLREGGLVAFPTETVYGLGADAANGRAVAAIFEAKGRPSFNPLIVHILDADEGERFAVFPTVASRLADVFWPGPLTIVLRRHADAPLSPLVSAGLDTVALRSPGHPVARALLEASGVPIAAPSANRSGYVSPTTAAHVAADLDSRVDLILDGGPASMGLESTVIDASSGGDAVLLRPGAVPAEDIARALGTALRSPRAIPGAAPLSPGQLASHYAPRARVRLGATHVEPGEALLAFGLPEPETAGPKINLSPGGDLREAASRFFAALRDLDAIGTDRIAVVPIPTDGLGAAINDRLRRAAAPHREK